VLFNSIDFAIFFPIVAMLYLFSPSGVKVYILLAASCLFYMAFVPHYIVIPAVTILVVYFAAIGIESGRPSARKLYLAAGVLVPCFMLAYFKYAGFLSSNVMSVARAAGWETSDIAIQIILPIGISFYTFQSLSYVVEVYRGKQKAERNFTVLATFVMFFPQLVAGPIERPQNLLHQFRVGHTVEYDRITSGLKRMALGFFKKLVVADLLAIYVNDVYGAPRDYNGLQLTIATVFFAYQIYCDFSGYSDIAVGAARVMGFRLMENFKAPYHAASIREFWQRWHISLSTWFRDYVYIPMGGNRVGGSRFSWNILATFAISGLWHGASWTFVAWGVLNGVYVLFEILTKNFRNRVWGFVRVPERSVIRRISGIFATFLLTCVAWILFRAQNMNDAWYILTHLGANWDFGEIRTPHFLLRQLPIAIGGILFIELLNIVQSRVSVTKVVSRAPFVVRWALYMGFLFSVILFGVYQETQFIYFQF